MNVEPVAKHDAASEPRSKWWWTGLTGGFLTAGLVSSFIIFSGPLLFLAGVIGLVASKRSLRKHTGLLAATIAVAANAFNLGASLWLLTLPAGTSVRPMIWNAQVLLVGVVTVVSVCSLSLHSLWKERRLKLPALAIALAIESLFLGWQVLTLVAAIRGFTISAN